MRMGIDVWRWRPSETFEDDFAFCRATFDQRMHRLQIGGIDRRQSPGQRRDDFAVVNQHGQRIEDTAFISVSSCVSLG